MSSEFPSDEQIAAWKKEYGKVFSTDIFGKAYIFRALTFNEFESTGKLDSATEIEDMVIGNALLFPDASVVEQESAGVAVTLAEEIIDVSCFASPERARGIMDSAKLQAEDVWTTMKSIVLIAMPQYRDDELDDLTFSDMTKKVALSEKIIQMNQSLMGVEASFEFNITDPAEETAKEEEMARKHAAQKKPGQAGYHDPIAQKLHQAIQ